MEQETQLFRAFSRSMDEHNKASAGGGTAAITAESISSMVNISEEIVSLGRIKDILDELNIMDTIMSEQKKILTAAESVIKTIRQYRGGFWGSSSGPLSMAEENVEEIKRLGSRASAAFESVSSLRC